MSLTQLFRPAKLLLVAALAIMLGSGTARAALFTIAGGVREAIGDPGGTAYGNLPNSTAGQGLPTADGGWPNTATTPLGFDTDASYLDGTHRGISGYKSAPTPTLALNVSLDSAATVRFTWMGKGDSTLTNQFDVFYGGTWNTLWANGNYGSPVSYDISLPSGSILFRWITGNSVTIENNKNYDPANSPGFFAGIDPYTAAGKYDTTGSIVYLGLTDLLGSGDHDFQDLGVRLEIVPEPTTLAIWGLGALGCAFAGYRRRKQAM